MKIHITLVGGQPAPIYNPIILDQPNMVYYIYSEQTEKDYKFINQLAMFPSKSKKLEVDNVEKISAAFEEIHNTYKEDEITINISGGPKSWTYSAIKVFGTNPRVTFIYMTQNNEILDLNNNSKTKFEVNIDNRLKLYGNSIGNNYIKISDYTEEDRNAVNSIKKLRQFNPKTFNKLTFEFSAKKSHATTTITDTSTLYTSELAWDNTDKTCTLCIGKFNTQDFQNKQLKSPNIYNLITNTGWFEYEIANLLSKWKETREIRINCRFKAENNSDKNEIDIILASDVRLIFVECKIQIHTITDIDKFASAVKNFGGTSCIGIFITDEALKEAAKEKLKDNKLNYFSLKEHTPEKIESDLFNLLDKISKEIKA